MNVPSSSSINALRSSSSVFMTMGPPHATGSRRGLPETMTIRAPSGPAWEVDLVPFREEDGTAGGLDHAFRLIGARTFHEIREHGIAGDGLHFPRTAGPHRYIKELHVHVFALCRAADIAVFSGDDSGSSRPSPR